jgi:hypothetical protein
MCQRISGAGPASRAHIWVSVPIRSGLNCHLQKLRLRSRKVNLRRACPMKSMPAPLAATSLSCAAARAVPQMRHVRVNKEVFVMPLVTSSAIQSIEFDDLTNLLQITFTSGKTYTYYAVPRSVYERFLNAPSKGTFFNEYIKDQYGFS